MSVMHVCLKLIENSQNVFDALVPAQEPGSRARGDRGSNQGSVPTPSQSKGGEFRWEGVRQQSKNLYVFINDSQPCLFSILSIFSSLNRRKQKMCGISNGEGGARFGFRG